ncbi:MAG: hypothetical protein UHS51_00790, partial [Atopobiaceae bacterium]|nr:hypothetical protein [Atopobiaceae bacterium]
VGSLAVEVDSARRFVDVRDPADGPYAGLGCSLARPASFAGDAGRNSCHDGRLGDPADALAYGPVAAGHLWHDEPDLVGPEHGERDEPGRIAAVVCDGLVP